MQAGQIIIDGDVILSSDGLEMSGNEPHLALLTAAEYAFPIRACLQGSSDAFSDVLSRSWSLFETPHSEMPISPDSVPSSLTF